ncbi:MAG: lasso peptide biosynthesis B2 protein [Alphaproteobacteria bacterium]|nr:lasso peptide biosynthesis B2 protein [Alphaproteobacteria bacterium]MBV9373439.1 lasso peptide biosynthesis B2 protein [Alphaproteobacteria bacterium]MBV9900981.1 lasso peptide biosynthesis B2 protein [Alphaproteobacteria bacterium]
MAGSLSPRRLRRLGAGNWRLLAEALPALVHASVAIRLLPFRRVAALASRDAMPARAADEAFLRKARWAVDAWADRLPWRAVCFQRGLALHRMLRRRGIASVLHYGVAAEGDAALEAHVWVTVDGRPAIGGEEAPRFTCVAVFPARDEPG